ncbi:oxidoreductase yfjr [Colletotrichum tabaci]|uniref:Oxidoreductase yfjr n=1 Tax=Colletotrichum tabaci TaxID=1209068 RepID=A0AAV9TK64_9PEZI
MATNLQRHLSRTGGPNLNFYNRTKSRGEPLKDLGGVYSSLDELATNSDVIFMSLSDENAVKSVLDTLLETKGAACDFNRKVIVDTSTIRPDSSAKMQLRLKEKGAEYVTAPVIGTIPLATNGQLLWVLAGADAAIETINPYIVGVMGRGVIRLGTDVRLASILKAVANSLTIGMMEIVAEAHVFSEKAGLRTSDVEELIRQQIGPAGLMCSQRLTTGVYMPPRGEKPWTDISFALAGGKQVLDTATGFGVKLAISSLVSRHLEEAKAYGDAQGRELDVSAIYGALRKDSGLSFETDYVKRRDGLL